MPAKKVFTSKKLSKMVAELTLVKKAEDVKVLDLRDVASITDFFVVCSGDSQRQIKAIADAVTDGLIEHRIKPWHSEGMNSSTWLILDFVDVVLHVFNPESRSHYNLEDLWGDVPMVTVKDNNE